MKETDRTDLEHFDTGASEPEGNSGNPAGHEPTDASGAKYLAGISARLRNIATAIYIAAQTHDKAADFQRICEGAADDLEAIGAEIFARRSEKRFGSSEAADGATPQDAEKVIHTMRVGGMQMTFSMYCVDCGFEVWTCPVCEFVRCRCVRCKCLLDVKSKSTNPEPR
jgi:hypothetical protein